MFNANAKTALRAIARGAIVVGASMGVAALAQPSDSIDVSGKMGAGTFTRTRVVETSDLNLTDARGQKRLDYRLKAASARVCDGFGSTAIKPPRDYKRCVGEALTAARADAAQQLASGNATAIRVASR